MEACVGISPPLESSPEEGIPEPFPLPCQVSFLQHRLNFLPPAGSALPVGTQEWSRPGEWGGGASSPRQATSHKRKRPLSNGHPGPQGGLHFMENGLNSLQGQLERVRWRLSCGGPRGLLPECEGGLLKRAKKARGPGAGGRHVGSTLCYVCEHWGPQTCPSPDGLPIPSHPHLSSCPQVPFDVRSPGTSCRLLWIQRRSTAPPAAAPRRQRTLPPGTRPPAGGYPSVCRTQGGGNLPSSAS